MPTQSARIQISGMTCNHCTQKVTRALQLLPGVISAAVQLDPGQADITFDDAQLPIPKILQAVQSTGFKATGFTTN